MSYSKLIIAYCVENQYVVSKIASAIATRLPVEKIVFDDKSGIETLKKEVIASPNAPVLLLITDNFLKSENCMNDALGVVQDLGHKKRLIPVVADGTYQKSDSGEYMSVPTSFERVSNVIQYMNYWQDKYLELRRMRPEDEYAHAEKVRVARGISTDIGEMLRYMRSIDYWAYDQLLARDFAPLFTHLGVSAPVRKEPVDSIAVKYTVQPPSESKKPADVVVPEPSVQKAPSESKKNEPAVAKQPELVMADEPIVVANGVYAEPMHSVSSNGNGANFDKKDLELRFRELMNSGVDSPSMLETLIEDIKLQKKGEPATMNGASKSNGKEDVVSENGKTVDVSHLFDVKPNGNGNGKANGQNGHAKTPVAPPAVNGSERKDAEIKRLAAEQAEKEALLAASKAKKDAEEARLIKIKKDEDEARLAKAKKDAEEARLAKVKKEADEARLATAKKEVEARLKAEMAAKAAQPAIPRPPFAPLENAPTEEAVRLIQNGRAEEGFFIFKKLLDKNPKNSDLRYQYATLLSQNMRFAEAVKQLELLVQLNPTHCDAYVMLAYLAEQQKSYPMARTYLEKVVAVNPDYAGIYYKLGLLNNEHFKGQRKNAGKYFREAFQRDPQNADAYYQHAVIKLEVDGNYELAIAHFEKTLELNPRHPKANFDLATAFYEQDDKPNAFKYYQQACFVNPIYKTEYNDEIFKYEVPMAAIAEEHNPNADKVVLITGATSGIGKATAAVFARNGFKLILTGRREDRLDEIKNGFTEEYKNQIQTLNFDVRNLDAVKKAVASLDPEWRNVDILINNAGLAKGLSPIHEGDVEDWNAMIDTNIKGLLYVTRAIAPYMVQRKKGHIINICSTAGKEVAPNGNVFAATKHAVDALTKAMRLDLYKHSVRVSQVAPGHVEDTEHSLTRHNGDAEKAGKVYSDFQALKAADVAEAIYFIVTRPEYVNIQDIMLMGTQQASNNFIDRSGRKE
jgi:NADP-dependent 3-hydroxy acid dehydrogenase YdfG/tetratricopeptide (TPR) repeat protein